MDDLGIKSGSSPAAAALAANAAKGAKRAGFVASLGGLAATFNDLIQKMGSRMNADVSAVTARAGLAASAERVQEPAPADRRDHPSDRSDDRLESRGDDQPRNERPQIERDERPDSRPRDRADDAPEPAGETRADNRDGSAGDRPSDANETARDDATNDAGKNASDERGNNADTSDGQSDAATTSDGDGAAQNNGETAAQTAKQAGGNANGAQQRAQQIVAGLTVGAQAAAQTEQSGQKGTAQSTEQAQGDKTVQNLAAAATADGKSAAQGKTGVHQADPGQQTQAGVQKTGQGQNQGQTQNQTQNQTQANSDGKSDSRNAAAEAVKASDGAIRQAADLARTIGSENRAQVQVSVKDEAAALVSKPASTLAPAGIGTTDGAVPTQHGQQAAAGAAQATAAAAQQASGQTTQQAASQQTANQVNQIQAAGGEAKGPTQAATHAGQGSQAATSAGGESQAAAGTSQTGEAAQTHKAQAAQATAATHRPQVHNQSFVDQISVNITKALRDGTDTINIQLRPAALGRIDVQLEVGHDGRIAAVITADNKDTLDMLQRDARGLEKALQDAGLQADAGSMSFNLREQGDSGQEASGNGVPGDVAGDEAETPEERLEAILSAERSREGIGADGRVDFWA